jgi:arylsulfatase A-like enzyme
VFADLDARYTGDAQRHRRALVEGPWKLLMDTQRDTALFDLRSDPGERGNRAPDARALRSAMRARILDRDAVALASRAMAPPGRIVLDPVRRAQLNALGYLQ